MQNKYNFFGPKFFSYKQNYVFRPKKNLPILNHKGRNVINTLPVGYFKWFFDLQLKIIYIVILIYIFLVRMTNFFILFLTLSGRFRQIRLIFSIILLERYPARSLWVKILILFARLITTLFINAAMSTVLFFVNFF